MQLRLLPFIFLLSLAQIACAADLRGDSIEIHNYQLKIDLRDFDTHILYGSARVGIIARINGVSQINLDMLQLSVDSVKVNGCATLFGYNDSLLHIPFAKALNQNDSAFVTIYYHGKPIVPTGDFGGFYWNDEYAFNIGVSFTSEPHNYGRVWFPCFDNFSTRSQYEFFVKTRLADKAFCNGLLMDVTAEDSFKVWHWNLKEDIPSYLASVAVAPYQTLQDTLRGIDGVIPVELAALAADTAILMKRFIHLHQAFHILERYWGPYRWEKVGYSIVPFQDGAMEHATNIAFMQNYLYAFSTECETTMAHELSHHWFGDLVTCDNAAEMWLNEGWATYSQSLFIEGMYGQDSARLYRRENRLSDLQMAHVSDGGYLPVSDVPSKQTYGSTVYHKGGDVIQTLRYYMGDSGFFHCVQGYLNEFAFKTASTLELRDYLSECSGINLDAFFKDWISSAGYTHFSISDKFVKRKNNKYEVYINIRQRISHATELYKAVPVTVSYFNRNMKRKDEMVLISGDCSLYKTEIDFKPEMIALDFNEDLAQAITADWRMIRDTGLYDFSNALMGINVSSIKDSSFIRVEHNWISATGPIAHAMAGLHLSNIRYWTVDGIFDPKMKATGIFEYSALPADHLDNGFIANEDSIVMMYRPDQVSDWEQANKFLVDKGDNDTDGVGAVAVFPLKKGQYALAVFNIGVVSEASQANRCKSLSDNYKMESDFQLVYDKLSAQLFIAFEKHIFERIEIYNSAGKKVQEQLITADENKLSFKLKYVSTETYIVTLTTKTGERIIKKLSNE